MQDINQKILGSSRIRITVVGFLIASHALYDTSRRTLVYHSAVKIASSDWVLSIGLGFSTTTTFEMDGIVSLVLANAIMPKESDISKVYRLES